MNQLEFDLKGVFTIMRGHDRRSDGEGDVEEDLIGQSDSILFRGKVERAFGSGRYSTGIKTRA